MNPITARQYVNSELTSAFHQFQMERSKSFTGFQNDLQHNSLIEIVNMQLSKLITISRLGLFLSIGFFTNITSAQIVSGGAEQVGPQFGLLHAGGMCIHPKGGANNPANGTPAILFTGCSSEPRLRFNILSNGSIYHASSGMCLHPEGGTAKVGARLVFWNACSDSALANRQGNPRLGFEYTAGGSLRHKSTGLCVHPSGGSSNPAPNTELVLWSGCDEYKTQFTKLW